VTVLAASRVTEQAPVPLQVPPVHPTKIEPEPGLCDTESVVPSGYVEEQVVVHAVPPDGVTLPTPVPDLARDRVAVTLAVNVAVTVFAASAVTEQVPVPLQAPDHPANVLPGLGVAVRVAVDV
jgi:hypothetical protein